MCHNLKLLQTSYVVCSLMGNCCLWRRARGSKGHFGIWRMSAAADAIYWKWLRDHLHGCKYFIQCCLRSPFCRRCFIMKGFCCLLGSRKAKANSAPEMVGPKKHNTRVTRELWSAAFAFLRCWKLELLFLSRFCKLLCKLTLRPSAPHLTQSHAFMLPSFLSCLDVQTWD